MIFEIIITIFISAVFVGVIYFSSRMVKGRLGLDYFYIRRAGVWEIDRIHRERRPLLSKKVGWLNIIFAGISLLIFLLMFLGIFDFMVMMITWVAVAFSFVVSFLIIFEIFARKKKEHIS